MAASALCCPPPNGTATNRRKPLRQNRPAALTWGAPVFSAMVRKPDTLKTMSWLTAINRDMVTRRGLSGPI